LFADGRYHRVEEFMEKTELNEEHTREILAFLIEYGFAEMNEGNEKARISENAKKLFSS
jgi:DNA-binding IclR family transcriptional regulator